MSTRYKHHKVEIASDLQVVLLHWPWNKAAMQAVWLVERLEASSLFSPALWHVKFTITFTAVCLSLFVTSNVAGPTVDETADAVRRIKEFCKRHAHETDSLRRCLHFLEVRCLPKLLMIRLIFLKEPASARQASRSVCDGDMEVFRSERARVWKRFRTDPGCCRGDC